MHLDSCGGRVAPQRYMRGGLRAIILDTLMGKGVPLFEAREKNHFIRVEPSEWAVAREQLG